MMEEGARTDDGGALGFNPKPITLFCTRLYHVLCCADVKQSSFMYNSAGLTEYDIKSLSNMGGFHKD